MTSSLTVGPALIEASQFVHRPVEEVFAFFAQATNLERITPPWLRFAVAGMSTEAIGDGTLIDYRLKLHGVPMSWRSRIEDWRPGVSFVDTQVKGPYAHWRHLHTFRAERGGTLVEDRVDYRVPLGHAGRLVAGPFVRANLRAIFTYRQTAVATLWPDPPSPP